MGVVHVYYKDERPPVVSRAIEHDGKYYVLKYETHYVNDKKAALDQIPPETIERTAPVSDRPSEIELALMKELIERAGKITVQMPVQIRDYQPRPNMS